MHMERIEHACPMCGGHVHGNDEYRFFCGKCNVLYRRKDLIVQPAPQKEEPHVPAAPKSIIGIEKKKLEDKFIVSMQTNKYHKGKYHHIHCPFIKKILEENLFFFEQERDAQAKNYEPCICLKNKVNKSHKFIIAKDASRYHFTTCPFATQIKPENRVYFDDLKAMPQATEPCNCLTKQVH
ncbi:MAG: hypothetical protein V1725_04050 [archaeon]